MEPLTNDVQAASCKGKKLPQLNNVVQPLLTDLYQITMAYAYWSSKKQSDYAVFDLFFRKNPFGGEFTVFAGLEDCLRFLENFRFTDSDIAYLKTVLPATIDIKFFDFLAQLTAKDLKVYSVPEGTVVFPRVPLLRVEGPLLVVQLIETTFLTLINYPSLVTTNAARFTICAGPNVELLEFGLRRAQGPDGGLSASKYTYVGGFSATSNVLAGKLFGIPVAGTHSHAFVMSFSRLEDCKTKILKHSKTSEDVDFIALCLRFRHEMSELLKVSAEQASDGELAAFISFAMSFPGNFLALIDTYDVIRSGLLNFCCVSLALNELGYKAVGVRLDSGDLSYLSIVSREAFKKVSEKYNISWFKNLRIVASNDINEETIKSLNEQVQGHEINCLGIGTHLVTCQKQPALGCVFKIVEVNSQPCIKLSLDVEKVSIPGKKIAYRLYGKDGHALIDLLQMANEPPPVIEQRVLCRHPFQETKRASVIPQRVIALHELYWSDGKICVDLPSLPEVRERVRKSLATLRPDIKRNLNPTPYKVSVSDELYKFMHKLWLENAPIRELS